MTSSIKGILKTNNNEIDSNNTNQIESPKKKVQWAKKIAQIQEFQKEEYAPPLNERVSPMEGSNSPDEMNSNQEIRGEKPSFEKGELATEPREKKSLKQLMQVYKVIKTQTPKSSFQELLKKHTDEANISSNNNESEKKDQSTTEKPKSALAQKLEAMRAAKANKRFQRNMASSSERAKTREAALKRLQKMTLEFSGDESNIDNSKLSAEKLGEEDGVILKDGKVMKELSNKVQEEGSSNQLQERVSSSFFEKIARFPQSPKIQNANQNQNGPSSESPVTEDSSEGSPQEGAVQKKKI